MLQIFITIAVIQVPLFTGRLEHFNHLHGYLWVSSRAKCTMSRHHGLRTCGLGHWESARGCLEQETEAGQAPLVISGVCLDWPSFPVRGFRMCSFLAKWRCCFGSARLLPSLERVTKRHDFLCLPVLSPLCGPNREHGGDKEERNWRSSLLAWCHLLFNSR